MLLIYRITADMQIRKTRLLRVCLKVTTPYWLLICLEKYLVVSFLLFLSHLNLPLLILAFSPPAGSIPVFFCLYLLYHSVYFSEKLKIFRFCEQIPDTRQIIIKQKNREIICPLFHDFVHLHYIVFNIFSFHVMMPETLRNTV